MSDYAFEGPTWSSSIISYSFAPAGGAFSGAIGDAYKTTVLDALQRWSSVANITFQQVADSAASDIRIGWGELDGTEAGETDYQYTTASGHSTFVPGVTVLFEDPNERYVGSGENDTYSGTQTTLLQVATHEFGHALGLDHSSQPTAVMYYAAGPGNSQISSYDIAGIQALYGIATGYVAASPVVPSTGSGATQPSPTSTTASPTRSPAPMTTAQVAPVPAAETSVFRFFDTASGTQFLTSDSHERDGLRATRPDLVYEGRAMGGVAADPNDANVAAVFRFFDTRNGTHFFTASRAEAQSIHATRSDLVQESTGFYEHLQPQAGDTAVYRFFDTHQGTHFFTSDAGERASILASRPDLKAEGIAFYAPAS